MKSFSVNKTKLGYNHPVYFIADIAANHNGSLQRAKDLIYLAAESGANAAKFQHFSASKIVSDYGFRSINGQKSHQEKWDKTVFEVYEDASVPSDWNSELSQACKDAGVHFFSSPYDFEMVDLLDKEGVPAYKIGSGDITWNAMLRYISTFGKPVFLATGASSMGDVVRAMDILTESDVPICLMQCNTNYTGTLENFKYINLNVLRTYATMWPDILLGLSDHTPGHATVLGAVALGARATEKHFTDDKGMDGPDHAFSMNPVEWRDMVDRTRELEAALGSAQKFVVQNEQDTVVLQRRCLRLTRDVPLGDIITSSDIEPLRPAPSNAIMPYDIDNVIGRTMSNSKLSGDFLTYFDIV